MTGSPIVFNELPRSEAKAYYERYLSELPKFIADCRNRFAADTGQDPATLDGTLNSLKTLTGWLDTLDPLTYQDQQDWIPEWWGTLPTDRPHTTGETIAWMRLCTVAGAYVAACLHDAVPGAGWVCYRHPKYRYQITNGSVCVIFPEHEEVAITQPERFIHSMGYRVSEGKVASMSAFLDEQLSWRLQGAKNVSYDKRVNLTEPGTAEDIAEVAKYHDKTKADSVKTAEPLEALKSEIDSYFNDLRGTWTIARVPLGKKPTEGSWHCTNPGSGRVLDEQVIKQHFTGWDADYEGTDDIHVQNGQVLLMEFTIIRDSKGKARYLEGDLDWNTGATAADLFRTLSQLQDLATTLKAQLIHNDTEDLLAPEVLQQLATRVN